MISRLRFGRSAPKSGSLLLLICAVLAMTLTVVASASEGQPYLRGPFGGEATYASGPLGGAATYWVPGRMRVAVGKGAPEFSLVKYIAIETGDENVKGFEQGYLAMGGFVAFAVEPVLPPPEAGRDLNRRAAILWKGLEIVLPGPAGVNNGPRILTADGDIGGLWNLNLVLEQSSFDPLWQDAQTSLADTGDGRKRQHQLGPIMACTLVYRNYRQIEANERRSYSVKASRFREVFASTQQDGGGQLAVALNGTTAIVGMMRAMIEQGVIEGIDAGESATVSEPLLLGLFSAIRQHWLVYDLKVAKSSQQVGLWARLREDTEKMDSALDFSPGEWAPVEEYRRIEVEIEGGACEVKSINPHGFRRETKLNLEFVRFGEFDPEITRVKMIYEIRTPDEVPGRGFKVLDRGFKDVDMKVDDPQVVEVKSLDKQDVSVRCKATGYWRTGSDQGEKFVSLKSSEWIEAKAGVRSHFFNILAKQLQGSESGDQKATE